MDIEEFVRLHELYINANVAGLPFDSQDVSCKRDPTTALVAKLLVARKEEAEARQKTAQFVTPKVTKKGVEFEAHDEEGLKNISEEIERLTTHRRALEEVVARFATDGVPWLYKFRFDAESKRNDIARVNSKVILEIRKASYSARTPEDIFEGYDYKKYSAERKERLPKLEADLQDIEARWQGYRDLISSAGV